MTPPPEPLTSHDIRSQIHWNEFGLILWYNREVTGAPGLLCEKFYMIGKHWTKVFIFCFLSFFIPYDSKVFPQGFRREPTP